MTRDIATRSSFGTSGDAAEVFSNQIKAVLAYPDRHFYHYRVNLTCNGDELDHIRGRETEIFAKMFRTNMLELGWCRSFVYDGNDNGSLFTPDKLITDRFSCTVELTNQTLMWEVLRFKVDLQYVTVIPVGTNVQEAVKVLNLILKHHECKETIEKSFDIDAALHGLRHSTHIFRVTQMGLSLRLNLYNTLHTTEGVPVLDLLSANQGVQTSEGGFDWEKAAKTLKDLPITDVTSGSAFTILGLTDESCDSEIVAVPQTEGPDAGEITLITVCDYYADYLNRPVTCSKSFPCIQVGNIMDPTLLAFEFCKLAPFEYKKDLTKLQRACQLEHSRVAPERRKKLILADFTEKRYPYNDFFQLVGLELGDCLASMSARVLHAPVGHGKKLPLWSLELQHSACLLLHKLKINICSMCF